MTDDRLNKLKADAEEALRKVHFCPKITYRDVLDLIKMVEDARAEIDRLHEEQEVSTTQIYTHVAQARKAEAIATFDAPGSFQVAKKRSKINAPR